MLIKLVNCLPPAPPDNSDTSQRSAVDPRCVAAAAGTRADSHPAAASGADGTAGVVCGCPAGAAGREPLLNQARACCQLRSPHWDRLAGTPSASSRQPHQRAHRVRNPRCRLSLFRSHLSPNRFYWECFQLRHNLPPVNLAPQCAVGGLGFGKCLSVCSLHHNRHGHGQHSRKFPWALLSTTTTPSR